MRFILLFTVFISTQVIADEQLDIEQQQEKCLENTLSNAGMTNCIYQSLARWDTQLNRVYQSLMSVLTEKAKAKLMASQSLWVQQRDVELSLIDEMYASEGFEGSMYIPMRAQDELIITQQRVKVLTSYLALHQTL